ncbi:reverse transcriptase domain-containing protein [Tanacetum coccineum]
MPSHVKTYDGSEDPEDHLKIFQAAKKVERWAMPTWCHMFNSTLTGSAMVWFDDLPPESVDSYDDLKEAFLANFHQQKKCIKDPVEIHHIKQREGESTEDFMRRLRQKKRSQAANRNQTIHEEVEKLINAGIMKEVYYHSWLANPVMVKKHVDSWRMCVDFKDLTKHALKMGYHQIKMAKEDEEKTTFITSQRVFCYSKMPFGLRNAGATYQRLVDKVFHKQIGRNLVVYVDDLVIKSRTEEEIIRDIKETFKTLREINMKLNPKKCTFGVEEGMFLSYKLSKEFEGVHEKASTETELFIQEITPTEVIHEQEGSGKASDEISTAGKKKDTASEEVPPVSTAEETATYSRRSAEKRKDKGKGIMTDEEPKKKSKKELEQERLSYAEALRLEEQMNEEQRAQIARDAEIARQWEEEEKKRALDEAEAAKKIDWNDPSVLRYHSLKMKPKSIAQARRNMIKYLKNQGNFKITDFKGMSYNEVRPIFEKLWDFNQKFVPMDAEKASKMQKSPEKERSPEKIVEEKVVTQEEKEEPVKEPGTKRKKSIPRKSTRKRQKIEEDSEKEELKELLDIIPREEVPIEVESISTKFPIVDWKSYVLTETFMYYQVFRGDGSSKNYKIFTEMLRDFDRHDVEELYRLVKERYKASRPEGYDLMLWGDLHTIFEPNADDELWKNLHQYNLISWSLYDFCGIHMLLMDNGMAIHMLTEKKYPLSQEMISKMLKKRLEVDHESTQAIELLRFIRSQVQK